VKLVDGFEFAAALVDAIARLSSDLIIEIPHLG
jgi:hypothetical protein